jgi:LPS-assembly lipoprotein
LAAITVEPIEDRIGQILRNELIDRLTPQGEPQNPRYRLHVTISESRAALAIQPDTSITRYNLKLYVEFSLLDAETGNELYRGTTVAIGSYNAVQSDFATLVAEQDSTRRAARKAGEDIHTLLSVYFSGEPTSSG